MKRSILPLLASIFLLPAACDPAPRALLYNHTPQTIQVNDFPPTAPNSFWDGIYVVDSNSLLITSGTTTRAYHKAVPPRQFWKPALMTKIYLLQLEPDENIYAIPYESLPGTTHSHPAPALPPQPPGFHLTPNSPGTTPI